MKTLLIILLAIIVTDAFVYLRFHNYCDNNVDLVQDDGDGTKRTLGTLRGKQTYCIFNYQGKKVYQNGLNGKLKIEFQFSMLKTFYDLNGIDGYDEDFVPMKLVPRLFGDINGTVIECKSKSDCYDAIHDKREYSLKIYKTNAEVIQIIYCPDRPPGDLTCHNPVDDKK